MIRIEIGGAREIKDLANRLRVAGNTAIFNRRLRSALIDGAKAMRRGVQANALAIPTHGAKHTGLRRRIADATEIQSIAGSAATVKIRLEVNPRRMPPDERKLPAYMEGFGRWRHPVFGHWLAGQPDQKGHPYFRPAVREHLGKVRGSVEDLMDRIAREIEGR